MKRGLALFFVTTTHFLHGAQPAAIPTVPVVHGAQPAAAPAAPVASADQTASLSVTANAGTSGSAAGSNVKSAAADEKQQERWYHVRTLDVGPDTSYEEIVSFAEGRLAVVRGSGKVIILDTENGSQEKTFSLTNDVSETGAVIATSLSDNSLVAGPNIWDGVRLIFEDDNIKTGKVRRHCKVKLGDEYDLLEYLAPLSNRRIVAVYQSGCVYIVNALTGEIIKEWKIHFFEDKGKLMNLTAVTTLPNNNKLAFGYRDRTVDIRRVDDGILLTTFRMPGQAEMSGLVALPGDRLAGVNRDGTVNIVDSETRKTLSSFKMKNCTKLGDIHIVVLSDGSVAIDGQNGTIEVWKEEKTTDAASPVAEVAAALGAMTLASTAATAAATGN